MSAFQEKIVYMGLEFQIEEDKVCYTPLKDKCDTIRNLESLKTLRQTRVFCGMVNFLSSFLPNLCRSSAKNMEKLSQKTMRTLAEPNLLKWTLIQGIALQ